MTKLLPLLFLSITCNLFAQDIDSLNLTNTSFDSINPYIILTNGDKVDYKEIRINEFNQVVCIDLKQNKTKISPDEVKSIVRKTVRGSWLQTIPKVPCYISEEKKGLEKFKKTLNGSTVECPGESNVYLINGDNMLLGFTQQTTVNGTPRPQNSISGNSGQSFQQQPTVVYVFVVNGKVEEFPTKFKDKVSRFKELFPNCPDAIKQMETRSLLKYKRIRDIYMESYFIDIR
jgi:hypothetical protein